MSEREPGQVFDRRMIAVASVTVMGSFMSILDTTIVNVAIPTFVRTFHTSLSTVQWVTTAYLLSLAVVVPLTRWAVDRFGAKRAWMVSLTCFLIGSLLCGLANSMTTLIVCRVLQGLGGGMILPIAQTILARESGPDRLGRVMTVVGVPQLLGPLVGPVAGGLILSNFSWRWIFFVNLPVGLVALVRSSRILEPGELGTSRKLDFIGLALLPPGLALLVYAISLFGNDGTFSAAVAVTAGIGVLLLMVFVVHGLHTEQPLLDLRLWKNHGLAASTSVVFLFGSGVNAAVFLVQLYYQLARGASPLRSALLVSPAAIGAMISLPIGGKIMDRHGPRRLVPFGLVLISIAVIPFTQVGAHTSELLLSAFWFLRGLGVGATGTPATASGYATLERDQLAGATTLNNIAQRVGNSLGVAAAAAILQHRIAQYIPAGSVQGLSQLDAAQRATDAGALAHAFGYVFFYTIILATLALVPTAFLPDRYKRRRSGDEETDSVEDLEPNLGLRAEEG